MRAASGRSRRRKKFSLFNLMVIVGLVGVGAVVAGVLLFAAFGPEPPASYYASKFEDAWNDGDRAKLEALFAEASREKDLAEMDRELARRGWTFGGTELGPPQALVPRDPAKRREGRQIFGHAVPGGQIRSVWRQGEEDWWVIDVGFSDIRPDRGARPELEQFRDLLAAGDQEGILALATESLRPQLRRFLGRFDARLTPADREGGARIRREEPVRPGRTRGYVVIGEHEIRLTLDYWHPGWRIVGMKRL